MNQLALYLRPPVDFLQDGSDLDEIRPGSHHAKNLSDFHGRKFKNITFFTRYVAPAAVHTYSPPATARAGTLGLL